MDKRDTARAYLTEIQRQNFIIYVCKSETAFYKTFYPEIPRKRPDYTERQRRAEVKRQRIIEQIETWPDEQQRSVLKGVFIKRKKICQIADALFYSESTINRVLAQALDDFYNTYLADGQN